MRYQVTPWRRSARGNSVSSQCSSVNPGRCQPLRSPNSPPLLSGPRTGSDAVSPWMRQLALGEPPLKVTAVNPRAVLWESVERPSMSCAIRRTRTDRTRGACPAACGTSKAAVAVQLPLRAVLLSGTGIRCVPSGSPSSHAISSPWVPVL